MPSGTSRHLALFYESSAQLAHQLGALLKPFVATGGRWLYLSDAQALPAVRSTIAAAALDVESGILLAPLAGSAREPAARITSLVGVIAQAAAELRRNHHGPLLVLVELSRAFDAATLTTHLREYEAAIDTLAATATLSVVCLYNQLTLLDRQLLIGLHTHAAICGYDGGEHANPYFVPPAIFARRDERAQFEHWLDQIGTQAPPSATPEPRQPSGQLQPIYHFEALTLPLADDAHPRWQITSLGQLRVHRANGEQVSWAVPGGATHKTRTLFAYLLFCGSAGAPTSELADLFWPDASSLTQSLNRLYHTVRCLRQALSPSLPASRESPFVVHRDDRYLLLVPPGTWLDLPVFQEHCYRANQHVAHGRHEQAIECYRFARQLYHGDLLADLPSKYTDHTEHDWCWSRRYWFRSMYLKVLHELATSYRHIQNIPEALAVCDEALRLEPCSDLIHQEKMRALHIANRRDALHRQYRLYCKALEQFGLGEPTEATTRLYYELSR